MNLNSDFSIKGKWWIPDKEGKSVEEFFGELTYKVHDGIQMVVESSFFHTKSILDSKHNIIVPKICGIGKDGQFITLLNNNVSEFGSNHWIYTEIETEYMLINDSGYFADMGIGIYTLNFSTNFFHSFFEHSNKHVHPAFINTNIQVDLEKNKSVEVIDNDEINSYFFFSRGFKGLGDEELTIWQKIFYNVYFKQDILLHDGIKKVTYYRDFFTFLSFPVVSYEKINFFSKDDNGKHVDFSLFFKQAARQTGDMVRPYEVLLYYEEVSHNLKDLLSLWIANEELNRNILAFYVQSAYFKFPSDIQLFLNMVFAIETFHTTFFEYKIFSEEELIKFKSEKKKAIKEIFSEEFKARLEECLCHFSNPSFSQRLKDLIVQNNEFIVDHIVDADDFVRKVTKQRNYLAHNHQQIEKAVIMGDEYPYFIAVLKMIFECSFLTKMGFEKEQIKKAIKRNFIYEQQRLKVSQIKKGLPQGD